MPNIKNRGFVPLFYENIEAVFKLSSSASLLYLRMLMGFRFKEDYSLDDEWIAGKTEARKSDVIRNCKFSKKTFYRGAWQELLDSGLVREEKGWIILPRYRLKPEQSKDSEKTDISADADEEEMKSLFEEFTEYIKKKKGIILLQTAQKDRESDPEMTPEGLADYFFMLSGQKSNKGARNTVINHISGLLSDYTPQAIAFGIKYVIENATEKIRTFKYIINGLPDAISIMEQEEEKRKKKERIDIEKKEENQKKQAEYEKSMERFEKLRQIKSQMNETERQRLNSRVMNLVEQRNISADFMTESVLNTLEIEILEEDGLFD